MKITRRQLRRIIREELSRVSEGYGLEQCELPRQNVKLDDVKDEAQCREEDLYWVKSDGQARKVEIDEEGVIHVTGLQGDKVPYDVDDDMIYTERQ